MKITDKQIRDYLDHNGHECKVKIRRWDGVVIRWGMPDPTDRSRDWWAYMGLREDVAREIEIEKSES